MSDQIAPASRANFWKPRRPPTIVAVEPDERVADCARELARTELINARIEDVPLETGRFDIIHSCHTIEHLAHPAHVLADHWRVLKDDGILILDAPNTAILGSSDIVEEWFIDKHLYHFSALTLERMIEDARFEIIEGPDSGDRSNLFFVARKAAAVPHRRANDTGEAARAEALVAKYASTRARNLVALTEVAAEIAELAPRGVAIWGAGRLFDSLVVHGHLDARDLTLLIDTHLKPLVGQRHGCALADPEALSESDASVIVVMSRDFAGRDCGACQNARPACGNPSLQRPSDTRLHASCGIGQACSKRFQKRQSRRPSKRRQTWSTRSRLRRASFAST